MACGTLNSPGPVPFLPQALMKRPSFENFTTRLFTWPSATKMSPLVPNATSAGPANVDGVSPATPLVPSVIATLPSGAILKICSPRPSAARPSVIHRIPVFIDPESVGPDEHLLAPHLQYLPARIQLDDRRIGPAHGDDGVLRVDGDAGHLAPLLPGGQSPPVVDEGQAGRGRSQMNGRDDERDSRKGRQHAETGSERRRHVGSVSFDLRTRVRVRGGLIVPRRQLCQGPAAAVIAE